MRKAIFAIFLIAGMMMPPMAINAKEGIAQYEYTMVAFRGMAMRDKNQIKVINEYAAKGWRLIAVISLGGALVPYLYFERKVD